MLEAPLGPPSLVAGGRPPAPRTSLGPAPLVGSGESGGRECGVRVTPQARHTRGGGAGELGRGLGGRGQGG